MLNSLGYLIPMFQVCNDYLTLIGEHRTCSSLDRKNLKKIRRRGSHVKSLPDTADRELSSDMFDNMASGMDMTGPSTIE